METSGGEQGETDNKTKASEPSNANSHSSLYGHHDRGEETEEDVDGEEKRCQRRSNVRVGLSFCRGRQEERHKVTEQEDKCQTGFELMARAL